MCLRRGLLLTGVAGGLAALTSVTNPNGWAGVLKVETPAGTTLGYILLLLEPAIESEACLQDPKLKLLPAEPKTALEDSPDVPVDPLAVPPAFSLFRPMM